MWGSATDTYGQATALTENQRTLILQSFGVEIGISWRGADISGSLLEALPPQWEFAEGIAPARSYHVEPHADGGFRIVIDDEDDARQFPDVTRLLDFLEGDIQIFVAEFATPHLFVHAGVVAIGGRAILIPGRSFAGKSTLTTSLVKAGATYYSDEYAVLDPNGLVLPYPRRVSLRSGPHGPTGRLDLAAHAPKVPFAEAASPVGLVALLKYEEDGGWDARELDHLEAIMAISEQTVAIQRRPADTFAILGAVARSATVIQGTRGDVDDTVDRLLALLAR
jgi:hypothetical protein